MSTPTTAVAVAEKQKLKVVLEYDETAIQNLITCAQITDNPNASDEAFFHAAETTKTKYVGVPLTCAIFDPDTSVKIDTITVDASQCLPGLLKQIPLNECGERGFFYLNGLLNALKQIRLKYKQTRELEIVTSIKYLQHNASAKKVGRWKKNGFKSAEGGAIKLRALWNVFFLWCTGPVRFDPLEVVEKRT